MGKLDTIKFFVSIYKSSTRMAYNRYALCCVIAMSLPMLKITNVDETSSQMRPMGKKGSLNCEGHTGVRAEKKT